MAVQFDQPMGEMVTFGIVVQNAETGNLVRRVMILSLLMALLVLVDAVISFNAGQFLSATTIVAAFIPLCGWAGARSRNPSMLRSFVLCNTVCASIGVLVLIINLAVSLPNAACICDDACFVREYEPGDRSTAASEQLWSTRDSLCAPGKDVIIGEIWLTSALTLAACMLQTIGVQSGKKLSEAILTAEPIPAGIPVAPVVVRPGEASQPRSVSHRFVQPMGTAHDPPYERGAPPGGGEGAGSWTPTYGGAVGGTFSGAAPGTASPHAHSGSSAPVTWGAPRPGGLDLAVPGSAATTGSGGFSSYPAHAERAPGQPVYGVGV